MEYIPKVKDSRDRNKDEEYVMDDTRCIRLCMYTP